MSSFTKKTWVDRASQYPHRRKINYLGDGLEPNQTIVEIYRDEGVVDPEGTAFSAENMNDLEDRISSIFPVSIADGGTGATTETGIRTNLGVMKAYQLFYNSSGTYGTITLSDTYSNYTLIRIYFSDNNVQNTAEFYTASGNRAGLSNSYNANNTTQFYIHSCLLSFSGSTATFERNGVTSLTSSSVSTTLGGSNGLYVKRIVGYKY